MLCYFLLSMGGLLIVGCMVIFYTMTADFKRTIKCYKHYLEDYKMKISISTYNEQKQAIKETKRQYAFLLGFLIVMAIFSITLVAVSLMNIRNMAGSTTYSYVRILQIASMIAASIFMVILLYNRINANVK